MPGRRPQRFAEHAAVEVKRAGAKSEEATVGHEAHAQHCETLIGALPRTQILAPFNQRRRVDHDYIEPLLSVREPSKRLEGIAAARLDAIADALVQRIRAHLEGGVRPSTASSDCPPKASACRPQPPA